MELNTFESIVLACIFIIPGFIINGIINTLCVSEKKNDAIQFIVYLFYSILHLSIFGALYVFIWNNVEISIAMRFMYYTLITIIGAILIGLIIGLCKYHNLFRQVFNKIFKVNFNSPSLTAWDEKFSHLECCYVIITLNDDKIIYGYYGCESCASSDLEGRDIYLEKIYKIDEHDRWIENVKSKGVLISYSQIKTIEFLEGENENASECKK